MCIYMKLSDFCYDLPEKLIARYPVENRSGSRLLVYKKDTSSYSHLKFFEILSQLNENDLLVFNDTRVIPARFFGKKTTGGKAEILLERILENNTFLAHIKTNRIKTGDKIGCDGGWEVEFLGRRDELFILQANGDVIKMLSEIGDLPLPPYFARECEKIDNERYQTVYARYNGSVAAPTAGLHFDTELLNALEKKGIKTGFLTLHVGAGTFKPVRSDNIKEHKMHKEYYEINENLLNLIEHTKKNNGRVIAVGTTVLRTLESVYAKKIIEHTSSTDIFIYPGFKFKVCDGLITNFHLPKTTLLMLVAAFIGYENMQQLYKIAIENEYRFFSYGDASLLI